VNYDVANPRPSALIESLRSVGYNLPSAIADIVDNSIAADADNISIDFQWDGAASRITILDDGSGMSEQQLIESMRPGTTNPLDDRNPIDLGRFGLGLKTASFSQCRKLSVWTKESRSSTHGRCWDLDYVALHNEWRLRKDLPFPDIPQFDLLTKSSTGTLVIWNDLDRVLDGSVKATNDSAHRNFVDLIKDVKSHLEMVFHRYLSGTADTRTKPLAIYVNGNDVNSRLQPWDPFDGGSKAKAQTFPTDEIFYHGQKITVRGYVMPHKDRLSDAEYTGIGGPKGWLAQQGYYIYRKDRILVAGDWLKLGRGRVWPKEEHYKLARLSIDIPNSMDFDWALDVKKSSARPPPALCARLTALAESVRTEARRVFAHRGLYGPRPKTPSLVIERPWESKLRGDRLIYRINRSHPLVADILQRLGPLATIVEPLLRLVEESVPIERIWLDKADDQKDHAVPYEGLDDQLVLSDIKATYRYLRQRNQNDELCRAFLRATSPFDRFPELIDQVIRNGE
jgi:hypothetical protein